MVKSIVILGDPVGKQRPRFTKAGVTYTPEKTRTYEWLIAEEWRRKHGKNVFGNSPLSIEIIAEYQIPESWSKKKKEKARNYEFLPCVKPDGDNVTKCCLDSLNGVAYDDDKQIISTKTLKVYASDGIPKVRITISDELHDEWTISKINELLKTQNII